MEHQPAADPDLPPVWTDHAGALQVPAGNEALALDTEFMRRNTFYPKLALVQAAIGDACWLIDPLAYDAGPDVRALTDGRTCIMHSASEDMEALAPLLGERPLQLFDTQIAAAFCGMGAGLSYQKLVASLLNVDIPKDETRSDWLQRPLTAGQLQYAAEDVTHLAALHARLADELARRGRSGWHAEDCARLVAHAHQHHANDDPQPQRALPAASGWPAEARARLRRVLRWRDASARDLDKPRSWLLDDAHALALCQQPPADAGELFGRVKGQRALRGAQRNELLALLHVAATPDELTTLAPTPSTPRGAARRSADAMRDVVHQTATRLDLPPGLLCPRRLLDEFVVTRQWPERLQGWRQGVLEAQLTPLLPAQDA